MYNFGAQPTDTWDLGIDTNDFSCSKSIVLVDSISALMIGSNSHRIIYTNNDTNASAGFNQKIIEHIGSLNYLFPTIRFCETNIAIDMPYYSFSCFQDITTSYRLVEEAECVNPYHVGLSEFTKNNEQIKLYPNPIEDKLKLQFPNTNDFSVSIYNTLGEKIIDFHNNEKLSEIDMSLLESGIYVLMFEDSFGEKFSRRVIKK